MLFKSLIFLLLSNSITSRRDKSILYSRIAMAILLISTFITYGNLSLLFLEEGIGIFSGLFHTTATTNSFHFFIFIISTLILLLTAFYPRKLWLKDYTSANRLFTMFIYYGTLLTNKMGEQFKIIEYSLIIIFILIGSVFLISTSDLVSIFLSIELQSYGLYILCAIYRDSEPALSGGLMYFLLGGLSSCFILLSTALLYSNSGSTNLDSLYIITSIYNASKDYITSLLYWYKSYYIHISLLFMGVGFLFKISAAPFHFWSPDVYDAIPTIVTTFVAIIAKISIFIFLLELVHYTGKYVIDRDFSWTTSLLFSSLLSLIIGTVLGLTQARIKRLFAFSTISHVGFILLGLTIHTVESTQAFIFYLIQYSISNLNAFMLIITIGYSLYCYVYKATPAPAFDSPSAPFIFLNGIEQDKTSEMNTRSEVNNTKDTIEKTANLQDLTNSPIQLNKTSEMNTRSEVDNKDTTDKTANLQDLTNSPIQLVDQLKGYYYINPVLSLSLAITLFSFAGIPPLIGFFGKMMVLSAAIDSGYIFMCLVAILTSVISAVYYLTIIKKIFFDKNDYRLNHELKDFAVDATIAEKNSIVKEVNIKMSNIVISSSLSLSISAITNVIAYFIFIPEELLSLADILALLFFNL